MLIHVEEIKATQNVCMNSKIEQSFSSFPFLLLGLFEDVSGIISWMDYMKNNIDFNYLVYIGWYKKWKLKKKHFTVKILNQTVEHFVDLSSSHVKVSTPFYAQERKGSDFVEINTI